MAESEAKTTGIGAVMKFFRGDGDSLSSFKTEWDALTAQDKEDLRKGIQDGSLTY